MLGWFRRKPPQDDGALRFSDALHETGTYRVDYGAWQPLALDGDPAMIDDMRRKDAARSSAQLCAMAGGRADLAAALLAAQGIRHSPDPDAWELIEHHLTRMAEPSQEPGQRQRGLLRPKFWAFLHDVGFLYARDLMQAHAGWTLRPSDHGIDPAVGYLSPLPELVHPTEAGRLSPIAICRSVGYAAIHDGFAGQMALPFQQLGPRPATLADDIRAFERDFTRDTGTPPSDADIVTFLAENGISPDELPPDMAAKYGF